MDTLHQIGGLGLATRLKRISERLSKDVSKVYEKQNIDFDARWFSLIYSLMKKSPMRITDLAKNIGITHTAVNQLAAEVIKKGYVKRGSTKEDERVKLLFLTENGKNLCRSLKPLWGVIKQANDELIEEAGGPLLNALDRIEEELDRKSMYERVMFNLTGAYGSRVAIKEYSSKLKKHFDSLNREWLEEYFEVEKSDESVLTDPRNKIIKKGGRIFFAFLDDNIAGTCAVLKHAGDRYEIAKMAVAKKYRGQGVGKILLEKAVSEVKKLGAGELYLQTNSSLKAANKLYRSKGFEKIRHNPFGDDNYRRNTYAMKLTLSKP